MILTPIRPVSIATITPVGQAVRPELPGAAMPIGAPVAAPAVEQAAAGAALAGKLIDFPGIKAGDTFDLVKGSKFGFFGIKGNAVINRFDDDHASFHVTAGKLGLHADVDVEVERIDDTHVRIASRGTGVPAMSSAGEIIETRTNFVRFHATDIQVKDTVISSDGSGHVTIDAEIPNMGSVHLELQRRAAS